MRRINWNLVVHFDRDWSHGVFDASPLDARMEPVAHLVLVVAVELATQESGDVVRFNVSFRQRCVIQKLGLFLLGLSCKDAAYRGTTDAESSGDFRLADTGAVQFVDLVGMQGGRDGASQTSAVLPGMCEAGTDSFA